MDTFRTTKAILALLLLLLAAACRPTQGVSEAEALEVMLLYTAATSKHPLVRFQNNSSVTQTYSLHKSSDCLSGPPPFHLSDRTIGTAAPGSATPYVALDSTAYVYKVNATCHVPPLGLGFQMRTPPLRYTCVSTNDDGSGIESCAAEG